MGMPTTVLASRVALVVAGLALGMIRERSLSVWPCVGLQILGSLFLSKKVARLRYP